VAHKTHEGCEQVVKIQWLAGQSQSVVVLVNDSIGKGQD
jgi:hypothetical protein